VLNATSKRLYSLHEREVQVNSWNTVKLDRQPRRRGYVGVILVEFTKMVKDNIGT
jgi:hypothetical protein